MSSTRFSTATFFLVAVLFSNLAAAGAPAEKRFHYRFLPNPAPAADDPRIVRATAIVRAGEFELIVDFGRRSWLIYTAQADRVHCRNQERIELAGSEASRSALLVDSPLGDCAIGTAEPTTTVRAGGQVFILGNERWKTGGAAALDEALGPQLRRILNGPIAALATLNPYVGILCKRMALVFGTDCDTPPDGTYTVNVLPVDCAFDARHGEPCAGTVNP